MVMKYYFYLTWIRCLAFMFSAKIININQPLHSILNRCNAIGFQQKAIYLFTLNGSTDTVTANESGHILFGQKPTQTNKNLA